MDEPVLTVPKLYVSLPTCLLRVVDNDSGEELTRVFQKVAPNNLKKNKVSLYFSLCFQLLEKQIENIHRANAANERSQENIRLALARSFQIEDLKLCRYAIISLE